MLSVLQPAVHDLLYTYAFTGENLYIFFTPHLLSISSRVCSSFYKSDQQVNVLLTKFSVIIQTKNVKMVRQLCVYIQSSAIRSVKKKTLVQNLVLIYGPGEWMVNYFCIPEGKK